MKCSNIMQVMEGWAPQRYAESWDHVGLQVGDPEQSVKKIFLALTPTGDVIDRAVMAKADLLITHHPLIFKALNHMRLTDSPMREVASLIRHRMGLFVAHTNLDAAVGGVNDILANYLSLESCRPLEALSERCYKLVTFVPETHLESLKDSLFTAGAGKQGAYEHCFWQTNGLGGFYPMIGADPYIGVVGQDQNVSEIKLEMLVDEIKLSSVLAALQQHHPYEAPAFDVFKEEHTSASVGIGRIGQLATAQSVEAVLAKLAERLKISRIPYSGDSQQLIQRVAVVGGSGSSYMEQAKAQGADLFITGDLTYHHYQRANELGLALADITHFAGERPVLYAVREKLLAIYSELDIVVDQEEKDTVTNEWRIV